MKMVKKKTVVVMVLAVVSVLVVAGAAFALSPGTETTGAELYDLIVNKFIKGPIGAAAGTGFMVVGAVMAAMGKMSAAIYPLIGGGILASASALANSLGMIA